jgi:hypothetical protein
MQTDVNWTELAMRNLKPLSEAMHARGISFAVIYNADASTKTNENWEQNAELHIAEIETALAIRPDFAVSTVGPSMTIHAVLA